MDKKSKISIFVIMFVIVCISIFLVNTYAANDIANCVSNSTANNEVVNKAQNEVTNNTIENNTINASNTVNNNEVTKVENKVNTNNTVVEKPNSEVSYTNGEEQAMKIAKDAWGDTEGVFFSKESITPDGQYVIVVTSDAKVLARYTINVDTGIYDIEYR